MRPWPAQDFALSGGGFETGLIDTSVYSSVRGNANTDTMRTLFYLVSGKSMTARPTHHRKNVFNVLSSLWLA